MMVAVAGNFGPDCSTVAYSPGIYEAAYSVGALITGTDSIASFSARGPVTADGSITLAQLLMRVIVVIRLTVVHLRRLRTSLAPWHCFGRPFRACKTKLTRAAQC